MLSKPWDELSFELRVSADSTRDTVASEKQGCVAGARLEDSRDSPGELSVTETFYRNPENASIFHHSRTWNRENRSFCLLTVTLTAQSGGACPTLGVDISLTSWNRSKICDLSLELNRIEF